MRAISAFSASMHAFLGLVRRLGVTPRRTGSSPSRVLLPFLAGIARRRLQRKDTGSTRAASVRSSPSLKRRDPQAEIRAAPRCCRATSRGGRFRRPRASGAARRRSSRHTASCASAPQRSPPRRECRGAARTAARVAKELVDRALRRVHAADDVFARGAGVRRAPPRARRPRRPRTRTTTGARRRSTPGSRPAR